MIAPKIKHVDQRPNGVLRFRRRFPKDVAEHFGKPAMQVHIRNTSGVAFHREYETLVKEFDRLVAQARLVLARTGNDTRTGQQKWHDALMTGAGLKEGITGLDPEDPETGQIILETMPKAPDPMVAKALVCPSAPPPSPTLADALTLYRQDKQIEDGSRKDVGLKRIMGRLEEALGVNLDALAVEDLSREHGRAYLQYMLASKGPDGEALAIGTCKREGGIIRAVVEHGLRELDLKSSMANPFDRLPWPKEDESKMDKKLPLPDEVVSAVAERLDAVGREPVLPLVWTILTATGARVSEIAYLQREDLVLEADIPHIYIRSNAAKSGRKTSTSVRTVPLTETAKAAFEGALRLSPQSDAVFPRYARNERSSDALSDALNKHVREVTGCNKKLTTHGLRHRVSDMLREAGAPTEVRQGFLGHANQAIAESTYGGREARLREFAKWSEKAGL